MVGGINRFIFESMTFNDKIGYVLIDKCIINKGATRGPVIYIKWSFSGMGKISSVKKVFAHNVIHLINYPLLCTSSHL